jgi:hypothetical protein
MTMVEVMFTPVAEDYVALQRAVFARQLRSRRFVGRMAGLFGCAVLAGVVFLFVMDGTITAASLAVVGGGIVGGFAALGIIIGGGWLLMPRRARRLFAQQRSLHHEMRLTLTPAGLKLDTVRANSFYPWDELPGWQLSHGMLLIYSNDQAAYYAPRRALSDTQRAQAVAILTQAGVPRR